MNRLVDLYLTFARIGGFTFGGGYAMLPMIIKECVDKKKWATEEEVVDYFAIGQCTPGVIAVNTATFVGSKIAGPIGGVVATLGVITPCWMIITIIALFISNFARYQVVQHALAGITVAVLALVLNAVLKLSKKSVVDLFGIILCGCVFALSIFTEISAAWLIVISGVLGLVYTTVKNRRAANGQGTNGQEVSNQGIDCKEKSHEQESDDRSGFTDDKGDTRR